MTRDHDIKRAIRARMRVTGEPYTVARSALVVPSTSRAPASETSPSQGGTMAAVLTDLLDELDDRGFAVLRSFLAADEVARLTAVVDEIVSTTLAEKQDEDRRRREAGETGWVDVWHPGQQGVVAKLVTERPDVAWLRQHRSLLAIKGAAKGREARLRNVGVSVSMPGYGHQGLHADDESASPPIGAWTGISFVVVLSTFDAVSGTFRAIPGSHRTRPQFEDWKGSAMPPHPEEVRVEAEPGDVIVHSSHVWKSATFNGGHAPRRAVWL
ncbi:MAG TPA: phytanoyl-CoA dioxygenase family protein [Acidimicrobiales bacterium]